MTAPEETELGEMQRRARDAFLADYRADLERDQLRPLAEYQARHPGFEAAIAANLDHPGICTVDEAGDADGVPFIAMRYVRGETLARRLPQCTGPLEQHDS